MLLRCGANTARYPCSRLKGRRVIELKGWYSLLGAKRLHSSHSRHRKICGARAHAEAWNVEPSDGDSYFNGNKGGMMQMERYRDAATRVAKLRFEREHVTDVESMRRIERELAAAEAALATQEEAVVRRASVRPLNAAPIRNI